MPPALLADEERERLVSRLVTRFAGIHSPERVREVVDEVYATFAGARIPTYVPVLAEHAARELLERSGGEAGPGGCPVTGPVGSQRGRPG